MSRAKFFDEIIKFPSGVVTSGKTLYYYINYPSRTGRDFDELKILEGISNI